MNLTDLQVLPPQEGGYGYHEGNRRVLHWELHEYAFGNFRLWDARIWSLCACCQQTDWFDYPNVSPEEITQLARIDALRPDSFRVLKINLIDSFVRLRDDLEGCYDEQNNWISYPGSSLSVQDEWMAKKTKANKQTLKLAQWFVANILKRDWYPADFSGQIMAHAKQLLADYTFNEICGCWSAVQDGLFGEFTHANYLTFIRKMEPPLIEQYRTYLHTPPPVYLETEYASWIERKNRNYDHDQTGLPVPTPELWPDDGEPR